MQTVGEALRAERERKGLTIKDVEAATSVRALYLTAIEEGNYKIVPAEVYLKGFIRSYANFLGLNPQEMIDLYRQEQNPAPVVSPAAAAQPARQEPPRRRASASSAAKTESSESTSSSAAGKWIVILAILAIAVGAGWWYMGGQSPSSPPPNAPQPRQVTPNPAMNQPPVAQSPVPSQPAQKKPVTVSAKYVGESWTLVTADGKEVYEGIPKINETLNWQADRAITVKVGNAAGVELTYNGQAVGKLGSQGEVVIRTFSANTKQQ